MLEVSGMGRAQFAQQLLETGVYDTPEDCPRGFFDRLFWWNNVWYRARIFEAVYRGSRCAKRGLWNRETWAGHAYRVFEAVEACGGKIHVRGYQHLAGVKGPVVCLANHMSILETMLLPAQTLLSHHTTYVVKANLLRYPIFGSVMRAVDPVGVGRKNPREDFKAVLRGGAERLKEGKAMIIFPQATRTVDFHPDAFNSLGVKLARRAGVPVVPVALKTDFHAVGKFVKDIGRIDRSKPLHFEYGEPMTVGRDERGVHERVVQFIADCLRKWGGSVVSS